jgi:hypothetical protein
MHSSCKLVVRCTRRSTPMLQSVNFSEFSKKCSERYKIVSAKEKGKLEDMAKVDKIHYEREMKIYIPS